jgi:glutathione-regulated potassium-efflux system ancillary protein KefC
MAGIWAQVALVFGRALAASVIAHRYRLSTALVEIIVGMAAGSILSAAGSYSAFAVQEPWVKAFAGIGAIFLTFLAGAELDPAVFRLKWEEAAAIGIAASSFLQSAAGPPRIPCSAGQTRPLFWPVSPSRQRRLPSSTR